MLPHVSSDTNRPVAAFIPADDGKPRFPQLPAREAKTSVILDRMVEWKQLDVSQEKTHDSIIIPLKYGNPKLLPRTRRL